MGDRTPQKDAPGKIWLSLQLKSEASSIPIDVFANTPPSLQTILFSYLALAGQFQGTT